AFNVLIEVGKQAVEVVDLSAEPAAAHLPQSNLDERKTALEINGGFLGRVGGIDVDVIERKRNVLAHEFGPFVGLTLSTATPCASPMEAHRRRRDSGLISKSCQSCRSRSGDGGPGILPNEQHHCR